MIPAMTFPDPPEPSAVPARQRGIVRHVYLVALGSAIALVVAAALVVPGWIPMLPRPLRRAITELMLRTVLVAYCALFVAATVGPLVLTWLWARAQRTGRARAAIERGFLVSLSCLFSLIALELGSAAWRGWMHRFPALPTRFAESPPDEYRIVVLGGSSALGEPYRPWLSVGQIVAWQLQEAIEGRRFVCEMLAWLGDSLEMQHHKLARLKQRPHAVIIYSGHNEFVARFEEEREGWSGEEPTARLAGVAYRATLNSPFCTLVYEVISKNRLDAPPSLAGRHQLIDPPQCSPVEAVEILSDFRRRLEALVAYCEGIGALPILIIPPANEPGFEPSRSTLPPATPQPERQRLVEEMESARSLESGDPAASVAMYLAILERHPGFAEAHFRLARLLEGQGLATEAAHHYLAALDHDGLPVRCPAAFREAYVEVARRHPRSILIDGRRELAAASCDGSLGDDVIQDTHHPTLRGYVALAAAVLREIKNRKVFTDAETLGRGLDPAACARHFGMDADKWATMCERTSEHYRRAAGYRYDPVERLAKSRRYADAARRIRSGEPPDDLGLPGIGTKPRAAKGDARPPNETRDPPAHGPDMRGSFSVPCAPAAGSFDDLFHLPVLQIDHRAAAQEADHRDELIPLGAADHLADHASQRAGHDADRRADGNCVFRSDRQARAEHRVDLAEVARECVLITDLDHVDQPTGAQCDQSIVETALQKEVAGEERNNRLELAPLRRAAFLDHLRKIVSNSAVEQVAGGRFFLPRFGMQAPPDRILGRLRQRIVPEIRRVAVGLGGQNGHSRSSESKSNRQESRLRFQNPSVMCRSGQISSNRQQRQASGMRALLAGRVRMPLTLGEA
jgi:hypothetical protein